MKGYFFNDDPARIAQVYAPAQRKVLADRYDVPERVYGKADLSRLRDAEILFSTWGMPALTREEIRERLPVLKAVFYAAGSVQAFAAPFLDEGVRVFSAWQANAVPVAEVVTAQILLSTKGFWYLARKCKRDYAAAQADIALFTGNYGAKVGILGYGAIAKRVVRSLVQHDLVVYVSAPDFLAADEKETGAKKADMAYVFSQCDVISNHIANNEHTKGIIDRTLLFSLKPYATFINTGRGAQADEAALIDKLTADQSVTAVLDVTDPEPPVHGSAFYTLPNVVLTPHFAGSSGAEVHRMAQYMLEEADRVSKGEKPLYEVTKAMLATMA